MYSFNQIQSIGNVFTLSNRQSSRKILQVKLTAKYHWSCITSRMYMRVFIFVVAAALTVVDKMQRAGRWRMNRSRVVVVTKTHTHYRCVHMIIDNIGRKERRRRRKNERKRRRQHVVVEMNFFDEKNAHNEVPDWKCLSFTRLSNDGNINVYSREKKTRDVSIILQLFCLSFLISRIRQLLIDDSVEISFFVLYLRQHVTW